MANNIMHLFLMIIFFSSLMYSSMGNPRADFLYKKCGVERAQNLSKYNENYSKLLKPMQEEMERNRFAVGEEGDAPNRVYALAQCMNDLSTGECRICFSKIHSLLPGCFPSSGGRVFLDGCFMRIENYNFFEESTSSQDIQRCSDNENRSEQHSKTATAVIDDLIERAPNNNGYADGHFAHYGLSVYGMANCLRTLNPSSCGTCLSNARDLVFDCLPSVEARALTAGCFLRYSDYDFAGKYPSSSSPSNAAITDDTILYVSCVLGGVAACLLAILVGYWVGEAVVKRRVNRQNEQKAKGLEIDSFHFKYTTLEKATQNFNAANKIGQGGFGEVFKGTLGDGREIAIKRLFMSGKLRFSEVRNEVDVIGGAQHKNLVRYLGCCFTNDDSLLVYEFLPNRSLDLLLFDPEKKKELGWKKRLEIIKGTAEGLAYLHNDCQEPIIHRDIKASNILLDLKHRPKISDFGLAMIHSNDQNSAGSAIAGTLGYMAPEYLTQGLLTEKVDVYSYGVLVLEIVSGVQNNSFQPEDSLDTLVTSTWKHFQGNRVAEMIDKSMGIEDIEDIYEVMRAVQIGLLCTQESASLRPTMANVIEMLTDKESKLSTPSKPPFLVDNIDSRKYEDTDHGLS